MTKLRGWTASGDKETNRPGKHTCLAIPAVNYLRPGLGGFQNTLVLAEHRHQPSNHRDGLELKTQEGHAGAHLLGFRSGLKLFLRL